MVVVAIVIRVAYLFLLVDLDKDHYYENGYIAKNIVNDRGFSLNFDRNNELRPYFNIEENAYPSAYMPPAYVYYLSIFMNIESIKLRNMLLFLSQTLLSVFLMFLIFKLTFLLFDEKIAIIAAVIYAFFPEFIFTVGIANSIIHFQIIIIFTLYLIIIRETENNKSEILKYDVYLSLIFALGIYFRSEFVLFLLFYLTYLFYKNNRKSTVIILTLVIISLLPWQIRNYNTFDKFVFLTTNSGFNIYRGHYSGDDFKFKIEEEVYNEMLKFTDKNDFEIIQKDIFTKHAINYIKGDIQRSIISGFDNIFKYIFIQYKDARSLHPLYLIPWIIMLAISVFGIIKSRGKPINKFVYFYILSNIVSVFIFFAIPRYQTIAKIVLVPYFAYGIFLIYNIYKQGRASASH